jgi:hypothetical protein
MSILAASTAKLFEELRNFNEVTLMFSQMCVRNDALNSDDSYSTEQPGNKEGANNCDRIGEDERLGEGGGGGGGSSACYLWENNAVVGE